jgi:hypothetical protein
LTRVDVIILFGLVGATRFVGFQEAGLQEKVIWLGKGVRTPLVV